MVGCGVPFTVHASLTAVPSDTSTDSKGWVNCGAVPVDFLAEEARRNAKNDIRREFMVSTEESQQRKQRNHNVYLIILWESIVKQILVLFILLETFAVL